MTSPNGDVSTREKILRAAEEILVTQSFSAITHRSVAKLAEVPLGSTTYHFKDKAELLKEVMRNILEAESKRRMSAEPAEIPSARAIADFLICLFVPDEFRNRTSLAILYERLLEAHKIEGLQHMVAQDQADLFQTVERQFEHWGIAPIAGAAMALVEGRAVQWLNQDGSFEQLEQRILEDTALLLATKQPQ